MTDQGIFDSLVAAGYRFDFGASAPGQFPAIISGFGAPTDAEAPGTIYLRRDAPNAALLIYVRAQNAWFASASFGDISVNTEALLSLVDVSNLSDGALAWVGAATPSGLGQSQGSVWQLTTTSAGGSLPALAAHLVIASSANGRRWMRLVSIPNQKWVQNATWYLDGTAGDDQNDGLAPGSPLQTGAELARRMAKQQVGNGSTVTVNLLSNITDTLDFRGVTGTISVIAVEPTQTGAGATGALTAAAAINHAANTFQTITAAGVDFAPFIATKSKIVLTSGTVGAWAWLESGAGGVGVAAQTSAFITQASPTSSAITIVSPAGNETYKIVSELTCVAIASDAPAFAITNALLLAVSGVKPTAQGTAAHGAIMLLNGCDMTAGFFQARGANTLMIGTKVAAFGGGGLGANVSASACLVVGNPAGTTFVTIILQSDTLMSDVTAFLGDGKLILNAVGFHNTTAARHAVDCSGYPAPGIIQLGSAAQAGVLYGSLAGAGSIGFKLGAFTMVYGGGVVPTMTTTGANVAFGSANKTWAQVPFSDYVVGAPGAANNSAWI